MSLDHAVTAMLAQNRRWAPVVAGHRYVGLLAVTDIAEVPAARWPQASAGDIARQDIPPASPDDPVSEVAERMRARDHGAIAVTDGELVLGVVTLRDLSNVEMLLDRLHNEAS